MNALSVANVQIGSIQIGNDKIGDDKIRNAEIGRMEWPFLATVDGCSVSQSGRQMEDDWTLSGDPKGETGRHHREVS